MKILLVVLSFISNHTWAGNLSVGNVLSQLTAGMGRSHVCMTHTHICITVSHDSTNKHQYILDRLVCMIHVVRKDIEWMLDSKIFSSKWGNKIRSPPSNGQVRGGQITAQLVSSSNSRGSCQSQFRLGRHISATQPKPLKWASAKAIHDNEATTASSSHSRPL